MASNKINEVLTELGNKISSIEGKVNVGRQQVTAYKKEIIDRLKAVVSSLANIQDSSDLKQIPELRGKLVESNRLLNEKTKELSAKTSELETIKDLISQQQEELKRLTNKINETDVALSEAKTDIANAKAETDKVEKEKESAISDLTSQLINLKQEKEAVEKRLADSEGELGMIAERIATINANLQKQIDMISTITSELNIDEPMNEQFQDITDNITAIMSLIQSTAITPSTSDATANSTTDSMFFYNKYITLSPEQKEQILYELSSEQRRVIKEDYDIVNNSKASIQEKNNAKTNINNILQKYAKGITRYLGGGRRRRTMKRCGKKNRKNRKSRKSRKINYKGGYVYSSSKELDKASSVMSESSNTNLESSVSKSKSKKRDSFNKRKSTRKYKSNK